MKRYLFIDHENIGKLDEFDQSSFQKIFVFVGALHRSLSVKFINLNESVSLEVIKVKNVSPNNLDFHLSYYMGKLDAEVNQDIEFVVYTKDKGFDHVIDYINSNGRNCSRITEIKSETSENKKSASKNRETAQIKSSLKSNSKSKPSKQSLSQDSLLIIQNLSNQNGQKRPRKKKTIKNHINTIVKNKQKAEQIYHDLIVNGLITENGEKISYNLGTTNKPKIKQGANKQKNNKNSGLSENAMKIIRTLLKMGNKRPRKDKTLNNHFKRFGNIDGSSFINELIQKNIIKIDKSGKVTYSLNRFK